MNKIELIGSGIDMKDYKQIINYDLKKVKQKNEKCFILLISYEALNLICHQLARYGYKDPLKYYEKMMEKNDRFCILLCNQQKFEIIKEDILEIL